MVGSVATAASRVRPLIAAAAAGAIILPLLSVSAPARGPEAITEVAETVIDAVVNISTSQKVERPSGPGGGGQMPQLPPGSTPRASRRTR